MTAMIERVAEAIRLAGEGCQSGAVYVDPQAAARAAIEAMRELTEEMHEAAEEISVYYDDFSCGDGSITLGVSSYRAKFNGIWGQLIDAALKEQP